MPDRVTICEMSPRDGMQVINRSARVPFDMRLSLLQALQRAGLPYIEAGSFVSAKFLPQFEDTPQLLSAGRLPSYTGQLAVLVPNLKFYERFQETPNLDTVALFLSASEEYSQKNKKATIVEDLADARQVAAKARTRGHRVRAHLSAAFRDPLGEHGVTDGEVVARICRELFDAGCEHVSLADTDGTASPRDIERIVSHLASQLDIVRLGVHLHDRFGQAIANAWEAYRLGIRIFDSAIGGIGGNKAVIDSVGNIATEDLVQFFSLLGVETGVDQKSIKESLVIIDQMTQLVGDLRPSTRLMNELRASGGD